MSSYDYFAAPSPRALALPPVPPTWAFHPYAPQTPNRGGQVAAGIVGFVFFVTTVVPILIALVIGTMMTLGGGFTF